ncbi:hypothetical protein JCGZ_01893 [Jatropha curcas]|uniref:Uncharacterized protein n=1 Tax=Jatropha curcas TaxID=180498 RepID=A0A067LC87_JATCU|nr:hypothetical protein JCGZ_01893 [Jatropha curcas]
MVVISSIVYLHMKIILDLLETKFDDNPCTSIADWAAIARGEGKKESGEPPICLR